MILGARLLLLIVILDCFLYFGMAAVHDPSSSNFGSYVGEFISLNGTPDANMTDYVDYGEGGTIVQSSTLGFTTIGIDSILGFVGMIWNIMTAPLNFLFHLGAPMFVQVVVGVTYIVMVLASVAQLITGRFA